MKNNHHEIVDAFGKLVMSEVRDDSMKFLQRLVAGKMADKVSKKLFADISSLTPQQLAIVKRLLAQAVDAGIVRFLNLFDSYEIGILFNGDVGERNDIRQLSDGLAGELYSESGWIAKFSAFDDSV